MWVEDGRLVVPVREDARLIEIVRALDSAGVDATDIQRRDPTLDDVFLTIAGRGRRTEDAYEEVAA